MLDWHRNGVSNRSGDQVPTARQIPRCPLFLMLARPRASHRDPCVIKRVYTLPSRTSFLVREVHVHEP